LEELFERYPNGEFYFITKFGKKYYDSFDFSDMEKDHFFVFGRETTGLPKELLEANMDRCLRIPMNDKVRSLNLSNTAAILVYEALRQQKFNGLF
jgi:tRNA (cytidine/uridine-2'-O-)-methyltransferase